jgi:hypothetical protein
MSAASALPWSRLNENQCVDFREGRFAKAFQKSAKQLLDAETYQRIMWKLPRSGWHKRRRRQQTIGY